MWTVRKVFGGGTVALTVILVACKLKAHTAAGHFQLLISIFF